MKIDDIIRARFDLVIIKVNFSWTCKLHHHPSTPCRRIQLIITLSKLMKDAIALKCASIMSEKGRLGTLFLQIQTAGVHLQLSKYYVGNRLSWSFRVAQRHISSHSTRPCVIDGWSVGNKACRTQRRSKRIGADGMLAPSDPVIHADIVGGWKWERIYDKEGKRKCQRRCYVLDLSVLDFKLAFAFHYGV